MSQQQSLFCSIRKEWRVALPEEIVRQRILFHMIEQKGFPASLIAVEQSLKQLPHLSAAEKRRVPNRRADIICFTNRLNGPTPLHPLMIVECKSIALTSSIMNQIVGYNHFVRSYFIAIANQNEIHTGWYDGEKKEYVFVKDLPCYSELLRACFQIQAASGIA